MFAMETSMVSSKLEGAVLAPLPKATLRTPKQGVKSMLAMDHAIWQGDSEKFLAALPEEPIFDLVVTSPL